MVGMTGPTEGGSAVVNVRPAVSSDAAALVELRTEMFRAIGTSGVDEPGWRAAAQSWFRAHVDDATVFIVVVEVGSRVVSTAMAAVQVGVPSPGSPAGRDVLINNVCTLPDARRQGYAQVAFDAVLDWARSSGATRADLMATGDGLNMYEAAGFIARPAATAMRVTLAATAAHP